MKNCYQELVTALNENKSALMMSTLPLEKNEKILKELIELNKEEALSSVLHAKIKRVIDRKRPELFTKEDGTQVLIEPFFPEARMIILGGGTISEFLVKYASEMGFKVIVFDDRISFANQERFPNADEVFCESYEKLTETIHPNENDFVVIVTRGHQYDMTCLKQVIGIKPRYLGMIGSQRRVREIKEQMIREGYPEELLNKMCSPIGFNIGGITPVEIAISIVAQIISLRRLGTTDMVLAASLKKKIDYSEMDGAVIQKIASGDEERMAIVTVTGTKGSTPRGAGAKMLVWRDGKTLGSIGGGCSEGEVIRASRDLLDEGSFTTLQVDMTADIAAEEGMVCGGIMDVLIEAYPY
ncbi:MAG: XdhC/CoxI family protein [Clostridiaceae bacterium]